MEGKLLGERGNYAGRGRYILSRQDSGRRRQETAPVMGSWERQKRVVDDLDARERTALEEEVNECSFPLCYWSVRDLRN